MGPSNKNVNLDQLSGRSLREAIADLDDKQILSLVQQLIEERESLLKRQEHLVSLSRLSEKTIAAADEVARQIKEEAKQQAETEAATIINGAKGNADKILEERRIAAIGSAQKEFIAVKAKYLQEFDTFSENSINKFESRIKEVTHDISESMSSYTESLKEQFITFQIELEQKLSALENTMPAEPVNITGVPPVASVTPAKGPDTIAGREIRIVEILAPRDKDRIDALKSHLDILDDVVQTELKHMVDRTLIEVTLIKPLDLTHLMADWPEVEMVQDSVVEGQHRTQVMLGVESEIAVEKGMLNHKINRIAHHIKPVD